MLAADVREACCPLLRRFKDDPEAPKERTFPPVDSTSVENFRMPLRRGQKLNPLHNDLRNNPYFLPFGGIYI